jgi:nitrite reductase/ring-hydroxylating ferredoxin subunit/uncharacterized membrane protein
MDRVNAEKILERIPKLNGMAKAFTGGLHEKILESGPPARGIVDLLHGTWLGHPLHAVLTDIVIGSWMLAGLFDLIAARKGSRGAEEAADTLTALGVASAVPTALAGLADFTTIPNRVMNTGAVHALVNTAGMLLNVISLLQRRNGRRDRGVFLSSTALGLLTFSAWLGGEMVFRFEVGTNKSPGPKGPMRWMPVLLEADLKEREPRRIQVEGNPVLLYRYNGFIHAMGAVCGHDGGPLEEGKFDGLCVECPWHQTVYDLRDGHVVHGPSTYAEPVYEVQLHDYQIWLRLKQG